MIILDAVSVDRILPIAMLLAIMVESISPAPRKSSLETQRVWGVLLVKTMMLAFATINAKADSVELALFVGELLLLAGLIVEWAQRRIARLVLKLLSIRYRVLEIWH
jgi:hypothetical protein